MYFTQERQNIFQYVLVLERHRGGVEKKIQIIKERIYIICIHNKAQNIIVYIKFWSFYFRLKIILVLIMWRNMYLCGYVHTSFGTSRGQKRVLWIETLELEFYKDLNLLMLVLKEKCGSSIARVVLFWIAEHSFQILLFLLKVKGTWDGSMEYGNCSKFWF